MLFYSNTPSCSLNKIKALAGYNFLCYLLLAPLTFSAQNTFDKGIILDSIAVTNSENETFALYLPDSFDKNNLSSIIFVFDPAARGKVGVAPFIEVAETYGHVIVCSNNSKNGAYSKNFDSANRLFSHIFKSFSIKKDGMYLAGFSGGSRLVSAIAVLTDTFAGVIACGAGFSKDPTHTPSFQKFAYVGLCGNEDMNFSEMNNNKAFLQKLNFKNTLFTYNGGHSWPPKKQINRAFRWLSLQNTKENDILLEGLKTDWEETKTFEDSNQLLFAAENYERILKNFKNPIDVDSIQTEYDLLLSSKNYKTELKNLNTALAQEVRIGQKLYERIYSDLKAPGKGKIDWWKKEFNKLKKLKETGSVQTQKMISRVSFSIMAEAYSRTNPNLYPSNPKQIDFSKEIISIFNKTFN